MTIPVLLLLCEMCTHQPHTDQTNGAVMNCNPACQMNNNFHIDVSLAVDASLVCQCFTYLLFNFKVLASCP